MTIPSTINEPLSPLATSNGLNFKSDLPEFLSIDKESAIKDERGLVHARVHRLPVDIAELFPLCGNDDSLGVLASLECGGADGHLLFN